MQSNYLALDMDYSRALQQPFWGDQGAVEDVRSTLGSLPPLIDPDSPARLARRLADVARGDAVVVQAGDCAEDPAECTPEIVGRKSRLFQLLAGLLSSASGKPVVKVGRIAGQYAKPRSLTTETVDGVTMPVYRGHLVNGPARDQASRRHDVQRLLAGHQAAAAVIENLHRSRQEKRNPAVWTSHEALVLDYEIPQIRAVRGQSVLTSTHWPWIGNRTRGPEGAHVTLLAGITNPVSCKIGPGATLDDLLALCAVLDPQRQPGRLTFTVRMGVEETRQSLAGLVRGVRNAGFPVIWMVDPMHANTTLTPDGFKTRAVDTLIEEVQAFQSAVTAGGRSPGGIHLELTPDDVTECVDSSEAIGQVGHRYTTLCDPRLNPRQATAVLRAWEPAAKSLEVL